LTWAVELHPDAAKQLKRLDRPTGARVTTYLREVESLDDPRQRGKALAGSLRGLWRYRVGNYRVVVDIYDDRCVVLALDVEHRSRVYRPRS
jgi:mRNA interferase RelE/StbE